MNLLIENIEHYYNNTDRFLYNTKITSGITGIFGLSGAGKTTLMNIISGIETPKSGSLVLNDTVLFDKENKVNIPEHKRRIGVVFQDNYLFPHLNIKKNLLYSKPFLKNSDQKISFDSVVELLELKDLLHKKPFQLSGGERQRAAIGRTLLSQPELLCMDEPFSNLDKGKRKNIISYLLKINKDYDIPLLIISHDLEDVLKLTRSLLIVNSGKIQASGNYLDIVNSGYAQGIISYKKYINIYDLIHKKTSEDEGLNMFSTEDSDDIILRSNTQLFANKTKHGSKVRLGIYPDDVVLNSEAITNTSIQNQLKGTVSKIEYKDHSYFVSVDCGIVIVAEVTKSAIDKMDISIGKIIYCLVKAKAIEIIHIY